MFILKPEVLLYIFSRLFILIHVWISFKFTKPVLTLIKQAESTTLIELNKQKELLFQWIFLENKLRVIIYMLQQRSN